MDNFILSCCSTADLSKAHFIRRNISYICFHFNLNGVDYMDDLGESIPFDEFYKALAEGADAQTSQVNIAEYLDYFTKILEQGKDILHVSLSSGISGTFNSAKSAALIAKERFPERKIYIVDSLGASSGYGLIMDTLADLRDNGMGIDELYQWVLKNNEDAKAVADLIEERFKNLNGKVLINNIGTTIGSHTGPGTVALFFWGSERAD